MTKAKAIEGVVGEKPPGNNYDTQTSSKLTIRQADAIASIDKTMRFIREFGYRLHGGVGPRRPMH